MIDLLSKIGRMGIGFAAICLVLFGAFEGYLLAVGWEAYHPSSFGFQNTSITGFDVLGAAVGGLLGLVFAGVALGAVATLYRIYDKLALLNSSPSGTPPRSEPLSYAPTSRRERLVGRE